MSDFSVSIVPKLSTYINNKEKAKEITDWLIQLDIIKPSLSDCILSDKLGHAISEGARAVTDSFGIKEGKMDENGDIIFNERPDYIPTDLKINGLEITTERTLFHTGENGIDEIICPICSENIVFEEWDIQPWQNQESENLVCPLCGNSSDISSYKFIPEFGFSNLGFTFWNWPILKEEFIKEFKSKLGCEIAIVYNHI